MSVFVDRLEGLMKERHLSWSKVSQDVGLGINNLYYWKTNDTQPKDTIINELCIYFKVPREYFLEDDSVEAQEQLEYFERYQQARAKAERKRQLEQLEQEGKLDHSDLSALDNLYIQMFDLLEMKDKITIIGLIMQMLEDKK